MNLKQVEKEIKKALDNLDNGNVKVSNSLKAEAITLAIKSLLETKIVTVSPTNNPSPWTKK